MGLSPILFASIIMLRQFSDNVAHGLYISYFTVKSADSAKIP